MKIHRLATTGIAYCGLNQEGMRMTKDSVKVSCGRCLAELEKLRQMMSQ